MRKKMTRILASIFVVAIINLASSHAHAANYCIQIVNAGLPACNDAYNACVSSGGGTCTSERLACYADVESMYNTCMKHAGSGGIPCIPGEECYPSTCDISNCSPLVVAPAPNFNGTSFYPVASNTTRLAGSSSYPLPTSCGRSTKNRAENPLLIPIKVEFPSQIKKPL